MKNFDARQTAREEEPKGWDCYGHPWDLDSAIDDSQ